MGVTEYERFSKKPGLLEYLLETKQQYCHTNGSEFQDLLII